MSPCTSIEMARLFILHAFSLEFTFYFHLRRARFPLVHALSSVPHHLYTTPFHPPVFYMAFFCMGSEPRTTNDSIRHKISTGSDSFPFTTSRLLAGCYTCFIPLLLTWCVDARLAVLAFSEGVGSAKFFGYYGSRYGLMQLAWYQNDSYLISTLVLFIAVGFYARLLTLNLRSLQC